MSILVVCPGCHKSFQVSEKFAGKSGPCPKCKATIRVPTKEEEVKVHAPTEFAEGGRGTTGALLTKPIARQQIKLNPLIAAALVAAGVLVLLATWAGGALLQSSHVARVVGLLVISPPLVIAAYSFLRDDELEPYRGTALYVRSAVCGAAYAVLWGLYGYLEAQGVITGELWTWLFIVPPFLAIGGLLALACLDLDYGNGFFHYTFYVLTTLVLRWAAGLGWPWDVANILGS